MLSRKPITLDVQPENFPAEVWEGRRMVCWNYEERDGDYRKMPRQPDGKPAKANDPDTWTDCTTAIEASQERGFSGVGFQLGDGICGVDLDDCRDPITAAIEPWAQEIINRLNSYAEVSPSGTGVKIWVRGTLPTKQTGKKVSYESGAIEAYQRGRYFAMTGCVLPGEQRTINESQDALDWVWAKIEGIQEEQRRNGNNKNGNTMLPFPSGHDLDRILRRAEKYISKATPAICGQGGHDATYKVACQLVLGFALTPDQAWPIIAQWNERCEPPWSEHDLRRKLAEADKQEGPRGYLRDANRSEYSDSRLTAVESCDDGHDTEPPKSSRPPGKYFNCTDTGNAERFVERYGENARYCFAWKKWLVWDGKRWAIDERGRVQQMALKVVRGIYGEAAACTDDDARKALSDWAKGSESAKRQESMLTLARSFVPITPDELNQHPWLINFANGTLDLKTGNLRQHRREDYITKLCPVDFAPDAKCPQWLVFLETIFQGKLTLIEFMQRLLGYALTGLSREHVLPIFYGTGANGKSTLIETILAGMGNGYAMKAPTDLLMAKSNTHPTEKADLFGMRFVAAVETESGSRLAESLAKEITGGDTIRARRMREDFWEFNPSHTVVLATNHKPEVRGTDNAIWRRLRLVPFDVTIPLAEQDKALPEKLKAELPGIMAWCVQGCMEWQRKGLGEPDEVLEATAEYRSEEDALGAFLSECCLTGNPSMKAKASTLYDCFLRWCEQQGMEPSNRKRFGMAMTEKGFQRETSNGVRYLGIGLRDD